MREVPLGELISSATVPRAGDGAYPLLSMTMHQGLVDQSAKFKKRVASSDTSEYKVISRGQLVVGFPIDEGVLDFQNTYDAAIVSPAYGVWNVSRPDLVLSRYLGKYLRSDWALAYYRAKLRGSTARRRSLPRAVFLELPVPLPPLAEQRRIAAILDHADALRAKRRQVLDHLDSLPQAIFHAMFGDDRRERVPISAFAQVRTGSTPSREVAANFGGTIPWVKTAEVNGGLITQTAEHVTERGMASARLRLYPAGSVVIAMYGQGRTRGQSAVLGVPAATNQACAVVLPNEAFVPEFLQAQLALSYDTLRGEAEGGNKPNLSVKRVSSFEVLLPPVAVQSEFARQVERVTLQRAECERALAAADDLFASLQSSAFRGALTA